jgi:hypothetical protein
MGADFVSKAVEEHRRDDAMPLMPDAVCPGNYGIIT